MSPLLARYHALPRATRWAIWGVGAVVCYFAIVDPVIAKAADLHRRAGERAARLVTLDREAKTGQKQAEVLAAAKFGLVAVAGNDPDRATGTFNGAVAKVLDAHGVKAYRTIPRAVPFNQTPL